jgi:DNA-binding NarL/FixJ family response regulator
MKQPRVLLADDHRMVAVGLKSLLHPEFELAGVVEDGLALIEAAKRLRPDVIVADISMPKLNGLDALAILKKEWPRAKVVFLTMHREVAYARRALDAGASGFVLKHAAPEELVAAMRAALAGKTYLTPALAGEVLHEMKRDPKAAGDPFGSLTLRQREVLQLFAEGCSAKEIAGLLDISARTVEFHKYQLMETLGLHNNTELTHFAIKHGIVSA